MGWRDFGRWHPIGMKKKKLGFSKEEKKNVNVKAW
jgi:hypothetical protein